VEVGCDIERVDPGFDFEELATRYFAPQEFANLQSLPAALRRAGFFWHWTLKEAYVKCRGIGLSLPLDSFTFSLAPDGAAVLQGTDDFTCASIEPTPGYQAAWLPKRLRCRCRWRPTPQRMKSGPMPISVRVSEWLLERRGECFCDACIGLKFLPHSRRQHVSRITAALGLMAGFQRQHGKCQVCGQYKLVICAL
jgi:4'-phosphopantetheinyl transferase superfamily